MNVLGRRFQFAELHYFGTLAAAVVLRIPVSPLD